MFSRRTLRVWLGLIFLSGMFLMGQGTWAPQQCIDNDGDGYGNPPSESCPNSGWDCNDNNPAINPGVIEGPYGDPLCNDGGDNDCDGFSDSFDSGCWRCDEPGDCDDGNPCTDDACQDHSCANTNNSKPCDDGDACTLGDVCSERTCTGTPRDQDDDGYGDIACGGDDCDDTNAAVNPGATEICDNEIDDECDDLIDTADSDCPVISGHLPDTGQDQCYNNTVAIECPAPGQPFYGQDAQYVTNPMSFAVSPDGLTVTDNVTGLMWQRQDDNTPRTWVDAISYCEGLSLAGQEDWRLPNEYELQSIVDYGRYDPAIDTTVFPGTNPTYYWSSSTNASSTYLAWGVYFYGGNVNYFGKTSSTLYVRCVSGEETFPSSFTDNLDGTVTDNATGLMWQQEDDNQGRNWESALAYCENLVLPPGGYTDWRLPDVKELRSIVDNTRHDPAIDTTVFPGTISGVYWSSSTSPNGTDHAWYVVFDSGYVSYDTKRFTLYVRCVR
jgi:hypothetical protein